MSLKEILWILLFGSLIGLTETFIGSFNLPYRSVILGSITLILLSIARLKIPETGTSTLIIFIAVLFKINNFGFHSCTSSMLLCGPTALLLLGVSYEAFASLFIAKNAFKYVNYVLSCVFTSLVAFSAFAVMNTYILHAWNMERFVEYIFIKGTITAMASGAISIFGIYLLRIFKNENHARFNQYFINSVLSCVIAALWVFGSFVKL